MIRSGPRLAGAVLAGMLAGAAPALAMDHSERRHTLAAAAWLAPGSDPAQVLTAAPRECSAPPTDPDTAFRVAVGRAAFRDPRRLGGQAARMGLSCQACHRNGHGNPAFHLPGLSDEPGTVDATHALFGPARGDGAHNPVPIPSLYDRAPAGPFGRHDPLPDLRAFIRRVIVEEFSGPEPDAVVLDGLVAYVERLETPCADAPVPVTADAALADIQAMLRMALGAQDSQSEAGRAALVSGARSALAGVHERFPDHPGVQARLAGIGRMLGGDLDPAQALAALETLAPDILAAEPDSLYRPSGFGNPSSEVH